MKYQIEVTENRRRVIEINADSLSDAITKVAKDYAKGKIVLSFHDEGNYEIKECKERNDGRKKNVCKNDY